MGRQSEAYAADESLEIKGKESRSFQIESESIRCLEFPNKLLERIGGHETPRDFPDGVLTLQCSSNSRYIGFQAWKLRRITQAIAGVIDRDDRESLFLFQL